jgi:hypothetical protein
MRVVTEQTLHLATLSVLAVVTRLPFLGIGEPDSALFVVGLRQWIRQGPDALFVYAPRVCAFYYAALARLVQVAHIPAADYALAMSLVSIFAGVGIVTSGYLLGVRVVGARASFIAMVLFVLSPGLWWVTMEAHPQAASICFAFLALYSFARYEESQGLRIVALSGTLFAVAIALKNDAVLLGTAFTTAAIWTRPERRWRSAIAGGATAFVGVLGSLLLTRLAMGWRPEAAAAGAKGVDQLVKGVLGYMILPSPIELVKQIVPVVFGLGVVTAAFVAVVVPAALMKDQEWRRWLFTIVAWSLPGYVFWMLIPGNAARHVIPFGVPLLWLCASKLRPLAVVACVFLSAIIPPNSNMFLFPSPNVPASARLAAAMRRDIGRVGADLAKTNSCFIGTYTLDYLADVLTNAGGQITEADDISGDVKVRMPNEVEIALYRRDPWKDKNTALGSCHSLEYNATGQKERFLGKEWPVPLV